MIQPTANSKQYGQFTYFDCKCISLDVPNWLLSVSRFQAHVYVCVASHLSRNSLRLFLFGLPPAAVTTAQVYAAPAHEVHNEERGGAAVHGHGHLRRRLCQVSSCFTDRASLYDVYKSSSMWIDVSVGLGAWNMEGVFLWMWCLGSTMGRVKFRSFIVYGRKGMIYCAVSFAPVMKHCHRRGSSIVTKRCRNIVILFPQRSGLVVRRTAARCCTYDMRVVAAYAML